MAAVPRLQELTADLAPQCPRPARFIGSAVRIRNRHEPLQEWLGNSVWQAPKIEISRIKSWASIDLQEHRRALIPCENQPVAVTSPYGFTAIPVVAHCHDERGPTWETPLPRPARSRFVLPALRSGPFNPQRVTFRWPASFGFQSPGDYATCNSNHTPDGTQAAGVGPQRYVTQRRLERAKTLMRRTNQPLALIARRPASPTRAI